jgi:uncharacterized membrane protein
VDTTRLEAFSDGVFAVAITLLVLNLHVAGPGHGHLGHQLGQQWPALLGYAISFLVIGVVWVNHHALFKDIARVDRTFQFANLTLLMLVTAFPFTTATLASYLRHGGNDSHLAAALYGAIVVGITLSFYGMCVGASHRQLFASHVSAATARAMTLRFGVGSLVIATTIGIAYISAVLALAMHALIAGYYMADLRRPSTPGASGA